LFNVTLRRISNGYIVNVTVPSTAADVAQRPSEVYVADAAAVAALLLALQAEHSA
jgi:hypothetical protein